jgi:hypothetical protein
MGNEMNKIHGRLVIEDSSGNQKIVLDASTAGFPSISILGDGSAALNLWVDKGNPQMVLQDVNGKHAVVLAVAGVERTMVLYDGNGLPSIRIQHDGQKSLVTFFKDGQITNEMAS